MNKFLGTHGKRSPSSDLVATDRRGYLPHIVVNAGAGTGKTFTYLRGLCYLAQGRERIDRDGIVGTESQQAIWEEMLKQKNVRYATVVAFNKPIAAESQEKLRAYGCPNNYRAPNQNRRE